MRRFFFKKLVFYFFDEYIVQLFGFNQVKSTKSSL